MFQNSCIEFPAREDVFSNILLHYCSLMSRDDKEAYINWLNQTVLELHYKFSLDKEYLK